MWPIVTVDVRSVCVSLFVSWLWAYAVLKRPDWSMCRLGCGLVGSEVRCIRWREKQGTPHRNGNFCSNFTVLTDVFLLCCSDDIHFVVVGQKLCNNLPLQNSLRVLTQLLCCRWCIHFRQFFVHETYYIIQMLLQNMLRKMIDHTTFHFLCIYFL